MNWLIEMRKYLIGLRKRLIELKNRLINHEKEQEPVEIIRSPALFLLIRA